jgi:hypothetical protein
VKTQRQRDTEGRVWEIALVPLALADSADFDYWQRLSPEARVEAVFECTASALKAQGKSHVPRLRRVARTVQLRGR